MMTIRRPVRIGNCSGFYGDRLSAAKELLETAELDVLTGDYLAELTMLILQRDQMRDASAGYAKTFLLQAKQTLQLLVDKDVKLVTNAGGMNPVGLSAKLAALAQSVGLSLRIATVTGDNVLPKLGGWDERGLLRHANSDQPLRPVDGLPLAANAYLGAAGITEALRRGADIVITGRTTDAASVIGAAAWWHNWEPNEWDALAGALAAGHVIECGTQATGGNYAFFEEVPTLHRLGFPIAEVGADGTSVITKSSFSPGLVSVGTVTAQLLYEIGPPQYLSPDVTGHFDTLKLQQLGPDRVEISGTRGSPPPSTLKVGVLLAAGYRNEVNFLIGGDRVEEKASLIAESFWASAGGKERFETTHDSLLISALDGVPAPRRLSRLTLSARAADPDLLGRNFTRHAIEMALGSVPGLTLDRLPGKPRPCGVFWPTLLPREEITQRVHLGEDTFDIPHPALSPEVSMPPVHPPPATLPAGESRRLPLGTLVGARSGDKGGDANVGFWVKHEGHWAWLAALLTADRMREWLGGFEGEIRIHPLPNLLAMNVELIGWLDRGVASNLADDPQAKCLAEALRTVLVDIDVALLSAEDNHITLQSSV